MQVISRSQAFNAGAQLWVIPNASDNVVRRIDWYLNFQLSRARLHQKQPVAPALKSVLIENEMGDFSTDVTADSPLAVIAGDRLPAELVVELPYTSPLKWLETVHAIWERFDKPRLRIFAPDALPAAQIAKSWPGATSDDFSVVGN
jgi:hypothetical protein